MSDHREQNKALSGIVQSMLITKHLLFVGFSLQDPLFTELAGTVRTALRTTTTTSTRKGGGGDGGGGGGGDGGGGGGDEVGDGGGPVLKS
eukprot:scaffold9649_cov62-Phaeocystis_antarctica.AAC.2